MGKRMRSKSNTWIKGLNGKKEREKKILIDRSVKTISKAHVNASVVK